MYRALRYVPRNHLSYVVGKLVHLPLPRRMSLALIHWFARRYGVSLDEAAEPPEAYQSLGKFFTRDLKKGARPIGEGIVSPVDGTIAELGAIEDDRLLQVKGLTYSVRELIQVEDIAARFRHGSFLTFYLAPGDYHHIHSPVNGSVSEAVHIPGTLWPVNTWSVGSIQNLFCVNERILLVMDSAFGHVGVMMVGATNVGSIRLTFDDLTANIRPSFRRGKIERRQYNPGVPFERGERLGTFHMGSTVILLFEPGRFQPQPGCSTGRVLYGTQLNEVIQ